MRSFNVESLFNFVVVARWIERGQMYILLDKLIILQFTVLRMFVLCPLVVTNVNTLMI